MELGSIVTASIAAFAAIIGSLFTWLATRPKSRADADLTSVQSFALLTAELRKERVELATQIERQAGMIERQAEEIGGLKSEVRNLRGDIEDIMDRWRRGEPAPPAEPRGNR